jgi:hypothetical protein
MLKYAGLRLNRRVQLGVDRGRFVCVKLTRASRAIAYLHTLDNAEASMTLYDAVL